MFDIPDLVAVCMVGDGEAETGPTATAWHSTKFLNPRRDGAVLPVLHLNGYKIANPSLLARITSQELRELFRILSKRMRPKTPTVIPRPQASLMTRSPNLQGASIFGPSNNHKRIPQMNQHDLYHKTRFLAASGRGMLAIPSGAVARKPLATVHLHGRPTGTE